MPLMPISRKLWLKVIQEETMKDHDKQIAEAYQAGYNDAHYDGLYLRGELPCQCDKCRAAYDKGQKDGVADLLAGK